MARKRKTTNKELDMSPFIGLFALLVVTLLLTASWDQLAVLSTTKVVGQGKTTAPPQGPQFEVKVFPQHLLMNLDQKQIELKYVRGKIDRKKIIQILKTWKKNYSHRSDVTLSSEDQVEYGKLIATFDVLLANGWADVSINTQ